MDQIRCICFLVDDLAVNLAFRTFQVAIALLATESVNAK